MSSKLKVVSRAAGLSEAPHYVHALVPRSVRSPCLATGVMVAGGKGVANQLI